MGLTYKQKFNRKYKQPLDKSNSLSDISRLTGFKRSGLQTIYNKGVGAFKTNPGSVRPMVKSKEQWAMGRVDSFVMKQKGTWGKADKDLADKVRKKKIKGYIK